MSSAVEYEVHKAAGKHGVAVLTVNNPPVNALSHPVRSGLASGLDRALKDTDVKSIVIIGGGKTFPAGADISEFKTGKAFEEPVLGEVINLFEQSPKPVVAALHGTALGGGLELALGCHYRIGTLTVKCGLPEVNLGLLPGAGGTQRLSRVVGVKAALDVIVSGQPVPAKVAQAAGLLDRTVQDNFLLYSAVAYAREIAGAPLDPRRTCNRAIKGSADELKTLFAAARKQAAQRARNMIAPLRAIDAIQASVELPFDQGLARERDLIAELFVSPQARALQYFFFAERQTMRIPGLDPALARPVKEVGIIGAGTMGAGIAMNFIQVGIPVVILEAKQEFLDRGLAAMKKNYEVSVKRGRMTEAQVSKALSLLKGTLDYSDLARADIVIEAVFESMSIKKEVFQTLDRVCKPEAFLCSNTSTLNVDEIAAATKRPERVMGTHFFSPANVMKLLENVRGSKTSPETIATVMEMGKIIRKMPVLVGNCEGFVGNRMLESYTREAMFLLEEGALPEQVDRVIYGFGMAMGPFAMSDLAGNDIGYRIRQGKGMTDPATRNPGERYAGGLGDKLCELNRLGQKTKAGWYRYGDDGRMPNPDPTVKELIEKHSAALGISRRSISDEEIIERCFYPLINEGFKILEEGIALRPSDIDVIWVYGYGFPAYRGGPMHYADSVGLKTILETMEKYQRRFPNVPHWQPAALLKQLAEKDMSLADYWRRERSRL